MRKIFTTQAPLTVSLLRMLLGWIFLQSGTGKLYGWFGGAGLENFAGYLKTLGILWPVFNAHLVGYLELFCSCALLLGFFTRPAAALMASVMVVAILTAHRQGGYHYPLTILACCFLLVQVGGGIFSIDKILGGSGDEGRYRLE